MSVPSMVLRMTMSTKLGTTYLVTPLKKSLAPNLDALTQHTKRANYQACIWKQCLNPMVQLPSPDEHGRKKDGRQCVGWLTELWQIKIF